LRATAALRTSDAWRGVPAVRAGRACVAPDLPFGWFDSPPSLNRLLGVQWLVRIRQPQWFPEPLRPRVKAFHALYYHRMPDDAQVRALLESAGVSQ
jgi:iron complex transport system substrate-binding protein